MGVVDLLGYPFIYEARLTFLALNPPTVTALVFNNFASEPVWARTALGVYTLTFANGPLTATGTTVYFTPATTGGVPGGFFSVRRQTAGIVQLYTLDLAGAAADAVWDAACSFKVQVVR